tara:strand:- start:795 stop:1040 length:246 start_codon:yes stop_codon:yes gene_type:complete
MAHNTKKIGNNDIIGERGVTAVRSLVLEMGFVLYETGGVEAGIDGFIEIRDKESGEVSNLILQVQCKATERKLPADSDTEF